MSDNAVIYGSIMSEQQRRGLCDCSAETRQALQWRNEPIPFRTGDADALIFVNLDDSRFADPGFLLSLSEAGQTGKLIGKADSFTMDDAIRFSKLGVAEILTSDQCFQRLTKLTARLMDGIRQKSTLPSRFAGDALIGNSAQLNQIKKTVELIRDVDFPSALILGETGTGKSLVSKILHNSGTRSGHNLVEVNCSAIPDELFESELFGHVKGAFTDAKKDKIGLFEYADNGTLFLDEVGNLSQTAQAKLLKIVEDRRLRRVGDVGEKDVNVRVVAATNVNLEQAINAGRFREDLFYRLNLITLRIPSLRERPDDIPDLISHFISFYSAMYGKPELTIEAAAVELMQQHGWPGNVRELSNVIERAVLLSKNKQINHGEINAALGQDRITVADRQQLVIDLPAQGLTMDAIEASVVKQVLNMFNWNKSKAAKFLSISRPRLRRILSHAGVEQDRRQH
jgi:two-component system NtrC family response regulator